MMRGVASASEDVPLHSVVVIERDELCVSRTLRLLPTLLVDVECCSGQRRGGLASTLDRPYGV